MKDLFQVACGSVIGRDHLKDFGWRNNQDSSSVAITNNCIIALVTDGCSASDQSTISSNEVGAKIGARVTSKILLQYAEQFNSIPLEEVEFSPMWERIRLEILGQIISLARNMGGSFTQTIRDYFLFTIVGTLMTKNYTVIFSIGDGVIVFNGEIILIGPYEKPPYISYSVLNTSIDPELSRFKIHHVVPNKEVETILIGTDGVKDLIKAEGKNLPGKPKKVGSISEFWMDDTCFANSDQIRRKLALVNVSPVTLGPDSELIRHQGLLPDDTTFCVIRKIKPTE